MIAAYLGETEPDPDMDESDAVRRRTIGGRGRWCVVRPLLETRSLKAGYLGREVVRAVNLTVMPGEVVCLLGPNGAGKSTTLMTIAGGLAPVDGIVMFDNVPTFTPMYQRVRNGGIGLVTEDRLDLHQAVRPRQPANRGRFGGAGAGAVSRARAAPVGAGRYVVRGRATDDGVGSRI